MVISGGGRGRLAQLGTLSRVIVVFFAIILRI